MSSTAKLRDLRSMEPPPAPAVAKPARRRRAVETGLHHGPRPPFRLLWLVDSLPMRAARRLLARFLGRLFELAAYLALALFVGLGSAWYMIDVGSRLTVERDGAWQRWTEAGSPEADPYTRAHFARAGWLPLSSSAAVYYTASRDAAGEPLYSDCEYDLTGPSPAARRWTLSAYDMTGQILDAMAGPPAVGSAMALPGPGGTIAIRVSQMASPGNWLSVSAASRMQLLLTLYGTQQNVAVKSAAQPVQHLFRIERIGCR